jgi:hypothetical protein
VAKGNPSKKRQDPENVCRILIRMMVTKTKLLIFALCLRLFLFSLARDMRSEVEGKGWRGMARQIKGSRRRDEATTKK